MHRRRWSDLEFVLAVAKEGSAAAAARLLGVNHATVIRRIQNFEAQCPEPIFEHRRDGYRLTENGEIFLEAAQNIDKILVELERKAADQEKLLSGHVRITTTDSLLPLLAAELPALRDSYPDITLDVFMTNIRLDLFNRDADIAIRPSDRPPLELVGRRIGKLKFGVYFNRRLEEDENLASLPWIALGDILLSSGAGQKIGDFIADFNNVIRADSFVGMMHLAEAGIGCGILPSYLGENSRHLKCLTPPDFDIATDIWLLSHKDILRARPVRVCVDHLYQALRVKF